jgi:hypothetical protein
VDVLQALDMATALRMVASSSGVAKIRCHCPAVSMGWDAAMRRSIYVVTVVVMSCEKAFVQPVVMMYISFVLFHCVD